MAGKYFKYSLLILVFFTLCGFVWAQDPQEEARRIADRIEKDGCAVTDERRVRICRFDYTFKGKNVEALSFRPVAAGKYPGLMLIPGYRGTPQRYINLGRIFAKAGFAAVSVGTPGFGKTELKPDFIGQNTVAAYIAGYKKFKKEPFVDSGRTGVFGYSRGAMAASLMLPRLRDVRAAIFGGGVYDMKKAYRELTLEGIRENIRKETGATDEAFKQRSSVYLVGQINCPVLIIHGARDVNVPVDQAYLLRDALEKHKKEFEIKIYEDRAHRVFGPDVFELMIDFFSRRLKDRAKTAGAGEKP